ncbi:ABC transporter permease, partial [Planktothrix sp. FACHB-1355]
MLVTYRIIWVLAKATDTVSTSPVLLGVSPTILWLVLGGGLCFLELLLPTAFTAFAMGLSALMVALLSTIVRSPLLQVILWMGLSAGLIFFSPRFLPKRKITSIQDATQAQRITEIPPGETGHPSQTDESSSDLSGLVKIYSGRSQLFSIRAFLTGAWLDFRSSSAFSKRLFLQNIAQRYRYSSFGLFWAFVPSALVAILLTLGQRDGETPAFGDRIPILIAGTVPPQVYGIFGLIMAQTFLEALNIQRVSLNQYIHLLVRQKIPLEAIMMAGLAESIFGFLMRLPVLIAILLVFNINPALTFPLAFLGIASIICFGSGLGLLLAPWNALSKDLENVMQFFPWFIFLVTPVFVIIKPGNWLYYLQQFNPLTYIFEGTRFLAYGVGTVNSLALFILLPLTVILLLVS